MNRNRTVRSPSAKATGIMTRLVISFSLAFIAISAASAVDHPFCLWTREEAAQLKKWIETDPIAKEQYDRTVLLTRKGAEKSANPNLMDLFDYLVLGDKKAGERQKTGLLAFANQRPEPMTIEFTLDEENHQWTIGNSSHSDRHQRDHQGFNALRYDVLYDELTPEQRARVEDAIRLYIEFHLAGGKPWHPSFRYDRTSWLPNMHWPRTISTHMMAVALKDEKLIKAMFESAGGFKWFMDEYLGDGQFYMEEFSKYSNLGHMMWYCEAVERLGLGKYGYGYVSGKSGGSMRRFTEMLPLVTYPRIEQPGGTPRYQCIWMGDTGAKNLVMGYGANGRSGDDSLWWSTANMGGVHPRMGIPTFEALHKRYPDIGLDYFMAQMRPPGKDVYLPSVFFGLKAIDAKTVKPPAAQAYSYATRGRGFALLRAEEGSGYWESPKPAVALQFGMYYVHYVHDCFSILQYVANNRIVYDKMGWTRAGYAGGDPWRDSVRGHSGVVVDGLQAQPVDHGNIGTANQRIRDNHAKAVKFVAARARGVYPDVDQERALFLTDEYLFDVFRLESTGAAAAKPRVFDWQVLTYGDVSPTESSSWTPLDSFSDKARATKPHVSGTRVLAAGQNAWTVTVLHTNAPETAPGVRVSMLADADTLVLSSTPPLHPAEAKSSHSILATRTAPSTTFVALHEPFNHGIASHKVERFECIKKTGAAAAVRVVGKEGTGIDDRILLRCGDGVDEILSVSEGGESFSFADHAYVRIAPETVTVVGKLRALVLPVKGNPKLVVNGKERPARIDAGVLKAEIDETWPPCPPMPPPPVPANTNEVSSLKALIEKLGGPDVEQRELAAMAIGAMGAAGKEAIPSLIACLKEKTRLGNKMAPDGLARIGPDAIPALIETMGFEDPYARYEAISAVCQMRAKGKPAVPALIKALDDDNRYVRINACKALYWIGPDAKEAIPALVKKLGDRVIGRHAAFALSGIGPAAAPALSDAVSDSTKFPAAAWGIEQMSTNAVNAVPALIKALVREAQFAMAAAALGSIGPKAKKAVPTLVEALDNPTNRPAAVVALGRIGPAAEDAVPALIRVAQMATVDKDGRTNCVWSAATIRALGQIGPPAKDAIPLLLQALQDQGFPERATAVAALGEIGAPTDGVLNALAASMKDRDQKIRDAAETALAGFGKDAWEIAPSLKECLTDANPAIRVDSAAVLVRIGAFRKEALSTLAEALDSKDGELCRLALNKTDNLGPKAGDLLPSVKKLATSENAEIRTKAAAAAAAIEIGQ